MKNMRELARRYSRSVQDVVRLAFLSEFDECTLKNLDLTALAEYERKAGGMVRVKLIDAGTMIFSAQIKAVQDREKRAVDAQAMDTFFSNIADGDDGDS